jgi:aspartate aminotransferase
LKITPEQLKKAITPRTKMIIINSPSNPSGAVYTRDELAALGAVLKGTNVFILSDEIYEHLIYEGVHHSIAAVVPDLYEQTIVANGVAKAYAMTGWRIGYAAGPKAIIGAMAKIQSQQTSNAVSIAQKATLAALTGSQEHLAPWKAEYRTRRDYIVGRLNAMPNVACAVPAGAFYVFPDTSACYGKSFGGKVIENSITLTDYLLEEFHVACVPGSGFGAPAHIRLSYATSMAAITKAMDRIEEGMKALK